MILYGKGETTAKFSLQDLRSAVCQALEKLGAKRRVLVIPPDFTRFHSQAGLIAEQVWQYYGEALTDVLPATGTHLPLNDKERETMFGGIPPNLFRVHDWRNGFVTLGEVPKEYVEELSGGRVAYPIPIQVDKLLIEGQFDLIISIGQVVPHEVVGMANYNKNIFVGTGGAEIINKTHFLGAVYGMERMMGRVDNPVRKVFDYGSEHFIGDLPIIYILTVVGKEGDELAVRGLFIGDDLECFNQAVELSKKVNIELVEDPLRKVVVYLSPQEFKSTWLGNKAIYRTRMAIAHGGELIILAPGLEQFGEDPEIDLLIRKYGYAGTPRILELVEKEDGLRRNLSAAAHLIHGSSEGRFRITYCPGHLTKEEIEGVNYEYADLAEMSARYDPGRLKDGFNTLPDGEEVFFISNPALGLWAYRLRAFDKVG